MDIHLYTTTRDHKYGSIVILEEKSSLPCTTPNLYLPDFPLVQERKESHTFAKEFHAKGDRGIALDKGQVNHKVGFVIPEVIHLERGLILD